MHLFWVSRFGVLGLKRCPKDIRLSMDDFTAEKEKVPEVPEAARSAAVFPPPPGEVQTLQDSGFPQDSWQDRGGPSSSNHGGDSSSSSNINPNIITPSTNIVPANPSKIYRSMKA